MKKFLVGTAVVAVAIIGVTFITRGSLESTTGVSKQVLDIQPTTETKSEQKHTTAIELMRYQAYDNLDELMESPYVLLVDYKEPKLTYKISGTVLTEKVFKVSQVLKGEEELKGQEIVITETGGTYNGETLSVAGDEPFGPGKYLVFLSKNPPHEERPYPRYVVQGVFSGKFKIENGKIKGFGEDLVRQEVEKLSEESLIKVAKEKVKNKSR
ncbi:hypothetical protein [Tumebacillus lipolyticus]|uniref:Uncharacterized protein n=1 Tax=Tumebacillus lipolyticus TaxID=1280370 RepID=A0ABW5A239_9BACL